MLKVCVASGCEEVSLPDLPHCAEHDDQRKQKLAERRALAQSTYEAKRMRKLYSLARWRKESKEFLSRHPICEDCAELGGVVAATDVDHKTPHRGDRKLFFDKSNWRSLCHACHSRKTAREVFHGGTGGASKIR